ncbi:MAG: ubiquinol-cytochrome c reductase iron-sulfur subunit [Woeseiaceae bacterium]|nr:ubiquinol-cytochrome c reductase iron-sulfur subunit [Woeseiaceae bacterium]
MSDDHDNKRRRVLKYLTAFFAGVGATVAAIPFVGSLRRPKNLPPPPEMFVLADITKLKVGQVMPLILNQKLVFILRRPPEAIDFLLQTEIPGLRDPGSLESEQPEGLDTPLRSIRSDIFVAYAECTHVGCAVAFSQPMPDRDWYGSDWPGGHFSCPCHGSVYDTAGRVHKWGPAPKNLGVPYYEFVDENTIRISDIGPDGLQA